MRQIFIATLFVVASANAIAGGPFGPDYGLGEVDGIVERVRDVPVGKYPPELADVFEHAINPETAQQVVVRLGDERAIVVVQDRTRRFQPGEHVLLVREGDGTRLRAPEVISLTTQP